MIADQYKVLAFGVALVGAMAAAGTTGWLANGLRLDAKIAEMRADHANERAERSDIALSTLKDDAAAIHRAATEYGAINTTLAPKIVALTKELRNAKPLPPDCRPTPDRVRNLDAAIDAANKAIPR
ncbi:hypothetical protein [Massilia sp. DD77]|uniref:hypothetical protein n=1 Tax=Massilia sp. DD77 TaxID=3109349 RepID=UPI00300089C8